MTAEDLHLSAELVREDAAEDAGRLAADGRTTCHTCKAWANLDHVNSYGHKRATGIPTSFVYDSRQGRFVSTGVTR